MMAKRRRGSSNEARDCELVHTSNSVPVTIHYEIIRCDFEEALKLILGFVIWLQYCRAYSKSFLSSRKTESWWYIRFVESRTDLGH